MPLIRVLCKHGFSGAGEDVAYGEKPVVDAASWAPWIEAGFLVPIDSDDNEVSVEVAAESYARSTDADPADMTWESAEPKFGVPTAPGSLTIEQGPPPDEAPEEGATSEQPEG